MAELTVTKIHIASRNASGNKDPSSGQVVFSDGKDFGWSWHPIDKVHVFYSYRKRAHGGHEMFHFRSPKRAAVLKAHLDEM